MSSLALSRPVQPGLPDRNGSPRPVESCPVCRDSRSTALHRLTDAGGTIAGTFELCRCAGCALVYVNPRPDNTALATLYDQDFYFSTGWPYRTLAEQVFRNIQRRRRRRVERYGRRGRLLDIGSGDGRFVHYMARHGWDATGIDFSPSALAFARRTGSGGRFVEGTLDDYDAPPARLDLVTLWQVLEHIGEPLPLLERCRHLMRPGGVLVAAVPNIDGLSARLTGERWWGLDVPRHLVLYTPDTLRRTLERTGFRVLHVRHQSFQYDPYALFHSSLDWVFTRRHFLSDLAKRQAVDDIGRAEYVYNVAALVALAPVLAPVCLAATTAGALLERGGFIEVHARRD